MIEEYFDITIIGAGVSGLILANEITERTNNKVLLIEKKTKFEFDKNLCFWSIPKNFLTDFADNRWSELCVYINNKKINLSSDGIEYLRIKSSNFYRIFLNKLKKRKNFKLLLGHSIKSINSDRNRVAITIGDKNFYSKFCFDSRIEKAYENNELLQHFYGAEIEFESNVTNNSLTLMDIQDNKKEFHFMYILPLSKKKIFIESTYFSKKIFKKNKYKEDLYEYLKNKYEDKKYKINFSEFGKIPMFKFEEFNSRNHIKIGTAGNWVRQSSGYSLQNAFEYSSQIVDCILKGKNLQIKKSSFLNFLDNTFCIFLKNNPEKSALFFEKFYKKNKLINIVNFLTNKAGIIELLKIIVSLPKFELIKTVLTRK